MVGSINLCDSSNRGSIDASIAADRVTAAAVPVASFTAALSRSKACRTLRGRCRYHFDIVDAWKDHTPRPFSSLPDTYSFLVKQPILWRIAYMSQQPRLIHKPYLWSCGNLIGRDVNKLCAPAPLRFVLIHTRRSAPLPPAPRTTPVIPSLCFMHSEPYSPPHI